MSEEIYKEQLKEKILANKLTNYDKGLNEAGTAIVADYPVLERISNFGNEIIDADGNLTKLKELKVELEKTQPFTKTQIRYLPKRANIYRDCCKELDVLIL